MLKRLKESLKKVVIIKLPHVKENTARELILLTGFIMLLAGLWGYDWRIACIVGGWMMIKFSGLVKRVII